MAERCEVQLDKPYYYAGDTINGFVICCFKYENRVREIRVTFKGEAKVRWKEGKRTFYSNEKYFELESNLLSSETTFQPGNYSYPFVFNLSADLPSSVKEQACKIKYKVKATVDKPWAPDYTAKKNFDVCSYINLNHNPSLKDPAEFTKKKIFTTFGSEKFIQVIVQLPKTGYLPGEMIFFTCSVINSSSTNVKDVCFNFVQGYELITKRRTRQILGLDGQTYSITNGSVPSKSEKTWDLEVRVPNNVYNGNITHCKIINAFWELRGEVCLPLLFSNIKFSVPIIIGSVPFQ